MTKESTESGRTVEASEVRTVFIVMPEMANTHGTLFGGVLMAEIDKAAAICAARHARAPVVTASIEHVDFLSPVRVGYFVLLTARMQFTGHTSMEVGVTVQAEQPETGRLWNPCNAVLTFVLADRGGVSQVPPVIPATEEEKARFQEGHARYQGRQARRGRS